MLNLSRFRTINQHNILILKSFQPFTKNCFYRNYSCSSMGVPLAEVVQRLQNIAPLKLAESWDNVGLLVEPNREKIIKNVLITIDLTEDVVDEAIDIGAEMIVSYHPNIFRPIKCITQSQWKERILVKCIQNDIAIFSPHTTWDAMAGGVNDWLASALEYTDSKPILVNPENDSLGMGRFLTLKAPITLNQAIENVKQHISISHVRVGIGKHKSLDTLIKTAAVCAGSGLSVLAEVEADLYLTGEMLHHDVLDATQKGINVILCNHSDSERGFLKVFKKKFQLNGLKTFVSKIDKDCLKSF